MKTYSQAGQDLFVINVLKQKQNGIFLDIGCNDPYKINNTYLLETEYNWNGISIDYQHQDYSKRRCKFVQDDALKIDYISLLKENNLSNVIDYLSLDIDDLTLSCLVSLPLKEYKFRVITIEHDAYRLGEMLRTPMRAVLKDNGYQLICSNVCANLEYEDWWVHPSYVNVSEIEHLMCDRTDFKQIINKF